MRRLTFLFVLACFCFCCPVRAQAQEADSFFVASAEVDGKTVSEGVLFLYQNETLFAPFSLLTDELNLPFVWNGGRLYGETSSGERVEVLPEASKARKGEDEANVSGRDFAKADGEWYLSAHALEELLGVEMKPDFTRQSVRVSSRTRSLPDELAADASVRRAALLFSEPDDEVVALTEETDSWRAPFVDVSARYNFDKEPSGSSSSFLGYSVHAFGPTGPTDSEVYVYDMDGRSPASVSVKTSRYEPDGKMLGLFKKIEIGDVYSFSNSAVNYAQSGRGVKFSSFAEDAPSDKTFSLREPLPLGWEAELYRNGELMGYRRAGEDGFLEFRDVPFLLGRNVFRLVYYGPQGQVRSEERVYYYTGNVVDKGTWDVKFNFLEKNKNVIETRKDIPSYSQGYNGLLGLTYGLADWLSAGTNVMYDSVERAAQGGFERKDKWFFSASLAALAAGTYLNAETVYDPEEGAFSVEGGAQTDLYGWDVAVNNVYYDGTVTQRNVYNFTTLRNEFTARINKSLALPGGWSFPFSYSFRRFSTSESKHQTEHNLSLYQNSWRGMYAGLSYRRLYGVDGKADLLSADINRMGADYSLRAEAAYDFLYGHLYSAGLSVYKDFLPRLTGGLKYTRFVQSDLNSDYVNRLSASLSWKTRWGYWTADFGVGDDHSCYGYIGLNLSLLLDGKRVWAGPDKLYGTGAVKTDVFLDENANGRRDPGEKSVPGASAVLSPRPSGDFSLREGREGDTLFSGLKAYESYMLDIDLNAASESASYVSAAPRRRVRVRPGQVLTLPCPVIGTGDVQGRVFSWVPGAEALERSGIILKLTDAKTGRVAARRVSEFDGNYLFERLPAGDYVLETDAAQLEELGFAASAPVAFSVKKNEELLTFDFVLERRDAPSREEIQTDHRFPSLRQEAEKNKEGV